MNDPALERLMARVDQALAGVLSEREARELEQHLATCSACESEIERVRLLRALLQNSCACSAPESLKERVRGQIRKSASYSEVTVTVRRNGETQRFTRTEVRRMNITER